VVFSCDGFHLILSGPIAARILAYLVHGKHRYNQTHI
jgi:hypothetical protein